MFRNFDRSMFTLMNIQKLCVIYHFFADSDKYPSFFSFSRKIILDYEKFHIRRYENVSMNMYIDHQSPTPPNIYLFLFIIFFFLPFVWILF